MKTEVRIVAGNLRGRKVSCRVSEDLRPTPQMVREAFFSILGNAIPDRLFIDIFAGTGVVGMEALSRGAKAAYFVERDFALADAVLAHLKKFDLMKKSKLFRTDSYRWVSSFKAPAEPINIFFSPPFADLTSRPEVLLDAAAQLQEKVAPDSVIVLQSERGSPLDDRAEMSTWERRTYGRNVLFLWQKEEPAIGAADAPEHAPKGGAKHRIDEDMTEREFALKVVERLHEAGYQALWAGGCVRDELLGQIPKDYDVATDARPERVQELFRRTVAIGASFGVVEVVGPKQDWGYPTVEVATFRSDGAYGDGRRPDEVVFSSPEEDAQRRDFTINGMFFDPMAKTLHDYVGGQADLTAKVLRAIGEPRVRFEEDKLRLLRAVRIAARFDLAVDPKTETGIRAMAREIRVVSAERIAEELRKILMHPRRVRGLAMLLDFGLADVLLPEIVPMQGLPQGLPNAPTGDLWDHTMAVLDALGPDVSFPLAMATLLHDVGKPRTVGRTPDRYTFYGHEHVGARMAHVIAKRLKLSVAERDRIIWLVERHQYLAEARQMRPSKLKMMLVHPGIRELLALHRADAVATGRSTEQVDYCEFLLSLWTEADLSPPPLLTGHDLTRHGFTPGPKFKVWLDAVREAQLDGTITTPEQAWTIVHQLANLPDTV